MIDDITKLTFDKIGMAAFNSTAVDADADKAQDLLSEHLCQITSWYLDIERGLDAIDAGKISVKQCKKLALAILNVSEGADLYAEVLFARARQKGGGNEDGMTAMEYTKSRIAGLAAIRAGLSR